MRAFLKAAAEDAIERTNVGELNRLLAGYWLSLWDGDALPRREQFDLARVQPLRDHLMLFDVIPEAAIAVHTVGHGVQQVTGHDYRDQDWLALAPLRLRNLRMRNMTAVSRGAVMVARRRIVTSAGTDHFNEELVLPFAVNDDGLCPVVAYPDWRLNPATTGGGPLAMEHCAREHKVITFGTQKRTNDLPTVGV